MILTNAEKRFIISNREVLDNLFDKRIEELKEEASKLPRGIDRDSKLDLVQEFRMWKRDFKELSNPEKTEKKQFI